MIRSALAVDLDQQDSILDVLAVPGVKGRQQLETIATSSRTNKSKLRDKQQQLKGREEHSINTILCNSCFESSPTFGCIT